MCKIEIEGVSINLTEEQLKQIDEQRKTKKLHYTDVKSYLDACDILNIKSKSSSDYDNKKEFIFHQLFTVIDAIHYLTKKPLFNDKKWYPYFEIKIYSDSGGLVFYFSGNGYGFNASVGFFIEKEISDFVGKQFIHLYSEFYNS